MAVEMAIWRMSDSGPKQLTSAQLDLEERLEDMLSEDPAMTGTDLLIVGRQVRTPHGGFIDLLGLDEDGRVHLLELKRDRTPREVVAQVLDYGSWVQSLTLEELEGIFLESVGGESQLDESFAARFDSPLPDVVNAEQQLTIVASELDPTSDRIVEFLATSYGVPINAVFFRHFADEDREYLARSWLLDPRETETKPARASRSKIRPWNGRDFYVVLGRADQENDRWAVAEKFGLLNAGGVAWHWKPLQNLAPGKRVFAYVGGAGYVGVGRVTGPMAPARDTKVEVDGELQPLLDQPEVGTQLKLQALSDDADTSEMVVPVEWLGTRPLSEAVWEKGLFASQVTVCRLRDEHTIELVGAAFGLDDSDY